jgi:hypothetical protein
MKFSALTLVFLFASAGACAETPVYDCVAPVVPTYSTTNEDVCRVEKQVRAWRACNVEKVSLIEPARLRKLNADVDMQLDKWILATRAYSTGVADADKSLTRIVRDKHDYTLWLENAQRVVYKTGQR